MCSRSEFKTKKKVRAGRLEQRLQGGRLPQEGGRLHGVQGHQIHSVGHLALSLCTGFPGLCVSLLKRNFCMSFQFLRSARSNDICSGVLSLKYSRHYPAHLRRPPRFSFASDTEVVHHWSLVNELGRPNVVRFDAHTRMAQTDVRLRRRAFSTVLGRLVEAFGMSKPMAHANRNGRRLLPLPWPSGKKHTDTSLRRCVSRACTRIQARQREKRK